MEPSQLIALVTSLASAVAAVLAWIAKIRWSDEYSKAKDETIRAKDTLIEVKDAQLQTLITNKDEIIRAKEEQIRVLEMEVKSLNELTPMKIREYFLSVREQMEEYNTALKTQLDEAYKELSLRKTEIAELLEKGEKSASEIENLERERQHIADAATTLEKQLTELQQKFENEKELVLRIPKIDQTIYENIGDSLKIFSELMAKNYTEDFARVSKALLETSRFAQREQEILSLFVANQKYLERTFSSQLWDAKLRTTKFLQDDNDKTDEKKIEDSDKNDSEDDADPIAA